MDQEVEALKHNLFQLCWFMRGGINLEQIYNMDSKDREIIGKIIKENIETTKDSGLPFF
jgi:hypothetical protein